jgi:hypothetical protein
MRNEEFPPTHPEGKQRGKGEKEKRRKGDSPPLCPFAPFLLFEGGWVAFLIPNSSFLIRQSTQ